MRIEQQVERAGRRRSDELVHLIQLVELLDPGELVELVERHDWWGGLLTDVVPDAVRAVR